MLNYALRMLQTKCNWMFPLIVQLLKHTGAFSSLDFFFGRDAAESFVEPVDRISLQFFLSFRDGAQ